MKITLLAFNGLMRGEMDIPKFMLVIQVVMDRPCPRLFTVEDEYAPEDTLFMKRATFEFDSHSYISEKKYFYRLVDVK